MTCAESVFDGEASENLSIYGSFLYGKSEMASDTTAASGAAVATKGHDTPDFPKFMLKGGLS